MSRHLLVDRPAFQLVVGFDHMLRSFFGQVFDPSRDPGTAIAGWPTSSGLGARRPVYLAIEANEDLGLLMEWAQGRLTPSDQAQAEARDHLRAVKIALHFEAAAGVDAGELPVPGCLGGSGR